MSDDPATIEEPETEEPETEEAPQVEDVPDEPLEEEAAPA